MPRTTRAISLAMSLLVTAALAVVPAASVSAAPMPVGAAPGTQSQACAALTSDLTSGLGSVTSALGGLSLDLSKVTGLVGTVTQKAQALIDIGCLPNPLSAVPALPSEFALPGLPGGSAVPPCAAPAADLLSKLLALVANLLKTLGGGLPDLTGLLGQVTGVQSTVTGLTSSVGGAPACLPAPLSQ